jgi:NTE family protein
MTDQPTPEQPKAQGRKKVAVACQGGGIHTSFAVGVLTEILRDIQQNDRFDLIGLSGTSGGALCTLMAWYGLAQKNGRPGSEQEAINQLNEFWDRFAATRPA